MSDQQFSMTRDMNWSIVLLQKEVVGKQRLDVWQHFRLKKSINSKLRSQTSKTRRKGPGKSAPYTWTDASPCWRRLYTSGFPCDVEELWLSRLSEQKRFSSVQTTRLQSTMLLNASSAN